MANMAGSVGGAISIVNPADKPSNLAFSSCDGSQCSNMEYARPPPTVNKTFREYEYNTTISLDSTHLIQNTAADRGGALSIVNGKLLLSRCVVEANNATQLGGGVYASGTSAVDVLASNISLNNALLSGHQFFSDAAGNMTFANTAIDLGEGSGFVTSYTGAVRWLGTSVAKCSAGHKLLLTNTTVNQVMNDWKLSGGTCGYGTCSNCPDYYNHCTVYGADTVHPLVTTMSTRMQCSPCPKLQYSLMQPSTGSVASDIQCLPCPFGGTCNGDGSVHVKPDFYGSLVLAPSGVDRPSAIGAAVPTVLFTTCPENYCANSSNTTGFHECRAASRRDPAVALCGACLQGYSQTLDDTNCVANSQCAGNDWFGAVFIAMVLVYDLFFLYISAPKKHEAKEASSSAKAGFIQEGDTGEKCVAPGEHTTEPTKTSMAEAGLRMPLAANDRHEDKLLTGMAPEENGVLSSMQQHFHTIVRKAVKSRMAHTMADGGIDVSTAPALFVYLLTPPFPVVVFFFSSQVTVFFFQMAMVIMPGVHGWLYIVSSFVSRLLNLEVLMKTDASGNGGWVSRVSKEGSVIRQYHPRSDSTLSCTLLSSLFAPSLPPFSHHTFASRPNHQTPDLPLPWYDERAKDCRALYSALRISWWAVLSQHHLLAVHPVLRLWPTP
jgi:hypothetical protein